MNMVPVTIDTCMLMVKKFSVMNTLAHQALLGVHLALLAGEQGHVVVDQLGAVPDFTHAMKCLTDIVICAVRINQNG